MHGQALAILTGVLYSSYADSRAILILFYFCVIVLPLITTQRIGK